MFAGFLELCSLFLKVKNRGTQSCLDTLAQNNQGGKPGLYPCHGLGTNQVRVFIAG